MRTSMTVQTPGSGSPQAGGTPAPQAGGAGSPNDPPQVGTPEQQEPAGQQGQEPAEGELPEPVREMLRNYRQENRSLRERLRTLEQGQQPAQQGDTITREAFQQAEERWQARLREQGVRSEVAMVSARLGVVDPEAAFRLLDTDDLDFDDKGQPTNVEAALKNLIRERPWLAQRQVRGGADGGAGGTPRPGARSMNDVLREATGRGGRGG